MVNVKKNEKPANNKNTGEVQGNVLHTHEHGHKAHTIQQKRHDKENMSTESERRLNTSPFCMHLRSRIRQLRWNKGRSRVYWMAVFILYSKGFLLLISNTYKHERYTFALAKIKLEQCIEEWNLQTRSVRTHLCRQLSAIKRWALNSQTNAWKL